ncbi:D-alanyl-lipoteichoic acid biosynthesis protein DltD [Streptococcus downei]|uniref:Protein DltD n=1 Tax=Streptococcus downei MFe28 TaxID=764290 RepID=A0A380JC97_STRDO|nr:D-alanyl-lipoteichoic acid biosynthesis protein DltD [Streptococcus downei]EFQ56972.1 DltD C-terminal domain protein [Streptococcus downei F0415]SUN35622.1 D-Alanine extra membranal transfer protein [Streptococcus downei MFe28]
MLKRLWQILGPLVCAMVLVVALIALYPTKREHSFQAEKDDAVALTKISFKSRSKKVRALSDPNHRFVPFFGSSEWSRMDAMHPSVLAEAYNRGYTPYLLGQRGAASLTQYFGIQQIIPQMTKKQAVYVISPQWFVKKGANAAAFQSFFSNDQMVSFLRRQRGTSYDQYAAKRFLELYPESSLSQMMEKVAKGQELSKADRGQLKLRQKVLEKEDNFYSQFAVSSRNYDDKIAKKAESLPKTFSYETLSNRADQLAAKATDNNPFRVSNNFFNTRLKGNYKALKGSQTKFDYTQSPEFNDLQLVLHQFAQMDTDVLFIIPPVNKKWSDYTGLDTKKYQESVAKIKYQLQSQGFNHIADLSKDGDRPYFMQDTIHLGWNGWLAADKYINPFLTQKQAQPNYQINDAFLSQTWANYTGQPDDFNK